MSEIRVMKKRGSANDDEIREEARTMADEVRVARVRAGMTTVKSRMCGCGGVTIWSRRTMEDEVVVVQV
jgi:plasmid stabilization system protein ParE